MTLWDEFDEKRYRVLVSLSESARVRRLDSWFVFIAGLIVWILVQGYFVSMTVHEKALPPEPKDALTYIVKTKQMEECLRQDCLALQDLRRQLLVPSSTAEEAEQRNQAVSKIFPVYHPLLSVIFLGLTKFGMGLTDAHNAVWTAAPLLFGLAFAYLLWALWGRAAAGLALLMLAFTIYPDTGLHHVVPSNLAMAIASILFARIITKGGDAPLAVIIGSCVLVTMHPIGRLYTVIAVLLVIILSSFQLRTRMWAALGVAISMIWLPRLLQWLMGIPGLVTSAPLLVHGKSWLDLIKAEVAGAGASILQVSIEVVRLRDGLFGHLALFFGAVMIGFILAPPNRRRTAIRVTVLYFCFFVLALFVVSYHPADIALRMWIPLVVVLHGAIGYGFRQSWLNSLALLVRSRNQGNGGARFTTWTAWPLVLFAILSGYVCQKVLLGAEHIYATRQFVIDSQPLKLCPSQPERLTSEAKAGDRVLYTSVIVMPYYFIHGSMQLGAVYYHPSLEASLAKAGWLARPDLRFAVTYNPTMYHPTFEGVRETNWWLSEPSFHFSPLSRPKTKQPLAREGLIRAEDYRYIEVEPKANQFSRRLRLHVKNFGNKSRLEVFPMGGDREFLPASVVKLPIRAKREEWIDLDFTPVTEARSFRFVFPAGGDKDYGLDAIVFGAETNLHWPWDQRASLMFMPWDCCSGPIRVSFDAANLLPEALRREKVTVLDDCGSAVLLKIDR